MSPTIPTAGGAGVVSQIGSGVDGWMLRVVTVLNVDHSRKTCGPVRQGEEVGSVIIHLGLGYFSDQIDEAHVCESNPDAVPRSTFKL